MSFQSIFNPISNFYRFSKNYLSTLINDLKFFGVLGFLSGWLIEAASYLPIQYNRSIFSALVFDHIPFFTIVSLFTIQLLSVLTSQATNKLCIRDYFQQFGRNLSSKLEQLSSPAVSVVLGLALTTYLISIYKGDSYSKYLDIFLLYALILFFITYLSSLLTFHSTPVRDTSKRNLAKIFIVFIIFVVGYELLSNNGNVTVSYEISIDQYNKLEKLADSKNVKVDELSHETILSLIK